MTTYEIICWEKEKKCWVAHQNYNRASEFHNRLCWDFTSRLLQSPLHLQVGTRQLCIPTPIPYAKLVLLFPRKSSLHTEGLQHGHRSCCSQWELSISVGAKHECSVSPWKSWLCTSTSCSLWNHLTPRCLTGTLQHYSEAASPPLIQFTYQ